MALVQNPFGADISTDDILDTLGFFDDWEERYKYIIDLGKQLPAMSDDKKNDTYLLRGCQSQVWIDSELNNGVLTFEADSDAHIVRGLLGVVLAAYNHKTPADIIAFDIDDYFSKIDLVKHLSPTRGNGLRAMVQRIQDTARNA
ncbi:MULTISPECIES: SufE family protein [Oceanospirillaceae]|jgi:cysteine desulfuration protein SufE|uniref:SufE family protein n=1 Tax=Oceanospirillaceae TaxID=135620 RepID=UPI0016457D6A|nr:MULTISPECIES: SufE family protein [Thalassolituus]MBU2037892.1 SufE family protein [Gammaproteobacteria bacterium]MCA6061357.1 SufE family protein [Thalassolituus sp. ST750PaO-4]MCB2388005.1 SufE family protein [Thalassolituus alkanivorans]MCB2424802.1 SufE family protein [Thalassolituus alkanivorans]